MLSLHQMSPAVMLCMAARADFLSIIPLTLSFSLSFCLFPSPLFFSSSHLALISLTVLNIFSFSLSLPLSQRHSVPPSLCPSVAPSLSPSVPLSLPPSAPFPGPRPPPLSLHVYPPPPSPQSLSLSLCFSFFGDRASQTAACAFYSFLSVSLPYLSLSPCPCLSLRRGRGWAGWMEETTEGRRDGERDGEIGVWWRQAGGRGLGQEVICKRKGEQHTISVACI